ncbi:MAG: DNA adenine methylase [Clostridia bacterium]|nr:DNA adenine methylase [Clostridia bacterium]
MENVKPFVKWAGGKGRLLKQIKSFYPPELSNGKIKRYVEPFVGGGAVLISILQEYEVEEAYAFDINIDLINCYNVIKNNVEELIFYLDSFKNDFLSLEAESRSEYFYDIRNKYNSYKLKKDELSIKRAAEFIFLNRTCFNGLYRVNQNGKFNVPFGKYKNPKICDVANLRNLSKLIENVKFEYGDYTNSDKYIDDTTFVYFDPPYRPISQTSSFTSYSKEDFNDTNQRELGEYFRKLDSKNAFLMLSNSEPKNVNKFDYFFDDIYKGFNINTIYAKRMINANSSGRGEISELLITNYKEICVCTQENSTLKMVASN